MILYSASEALFSVKETNYDISEKKILDNIKKMFTQEFDILQKKFHSINNEYKHMKDYLFDLLDNIKSANNNLASAETLMNFSSMTAAVDLIHKDLVKFDTQNKNALRTIYHFLHSNSEDNKKMDVVLKRLEKIEQTQEIIMKILESFKERLELSKPA